MTALLNVQNLSKTYQQGGARIDVLQDLSLAMAEGETVAVLGQSGSGKSTLLSLLAGLDLPDRGAIEVDRQDIVRMSEVELAAFRAKNLGIVFQQFHLMSNLTALENVALPLEITDTPKALTKAAQVLAQVGLEARASHFPHQLSGGERQRVAMARAMVTAPRLLLADEPSGNLDAKTGEQVMQQLFDLVGRRKMTMILVTHNEALARRCGRQLRLENGKLN